MASVAGGLRGMEEGFREERKVKPQVLPELRPGTTEQAPQPAPPREPQGFPDQPSRGPAEMEELQHALKQSPPAHKRSSRSRPTTDETP